MTEDRYDVVVVGARCAGAPLAALLARAGARVAVVERAIFPSETLSSHLFEVDALAFLDRLGVSDALHATGAPLVQRADMRVEDLRIEIDLPQRPGDVGGMCSVRRSLLDPLLAGAAEEAGAELIAAIEVTSLVEDGGRVAGVRVKSKGGQVQAGEDPENSRSEGEGGESELRARLVVGADGRHSTVAKLCGARRYNVTPNQRLLYWAFFEGADMGTGADVSNASLGRALHSWDPLRQRPLPGPDLAGNGRTGGLSRGSRGGVHGPRVHLRADRAGARRRAVGRQGARRGALGGILPRGLRARLGAERGRRALQEPLARTRDRRRVSAGRERARARSPAPWRNRRPVYAAA